MSALVAATCNALAELLEEGPADAWNRPTACEGWQVRHVVAHLTMPARYDEPTFLSLLAGEGFDFAKLSDRLASGDGALPETMLVANLRADALHRWEPPGGGPQGALDHAVIHALDVTVPLGAYSCIPTDAVRAVLDDLTTGGAHAHFGTAIGVEDAAGTDEERVLRLAGRHV